MKVTQGKHTPGPWADDTQEHDCPYQDIIIKAGSRGICRIWMDDAPVHDFNSEQDANARLIAAAPDLLEALDGMLQIYGGNKDWDGLKSSTELDCIEQARVAIAKATGVKE